MMRGWICENPIGVDALRWQEMPVPEPRAGEVRVEVHAASLNFPDLLKVQGKYQIKPPLPFVPGSEFAGTVRALGPGVSGLAVGQRVACLAGTGGFATHAVAPVAKCLALPDDFPFEEACAFIMTYATSYHALVDRGALQAGETVLVLGAAGGVGTAAIQVAKAAGARVIAAASSTAKCARCMALGADAAIDYSRENLRESLKALTGGRGPDVIYDPVGGDLAEPAFRSIAWRGRYLVIGFAAGGAIPALPLNLMLLKGASVVGVIWGNVVLHEPETHAATLQALLRWHAEGKLKPVIDRVLPMRELRAAFEAMGTRAVQGKLVLVNGSDAHSVLGDRDGS